MPRGIQLSPYNEYKDVTREVHTNFKMTLAILVKIELLSQF